MDHEAKYENDVEYDDESSPSTIHLPHPAPSLGLFSTLEVRPSSSPYDLTSRLISFPKNNYSSPPHLAGGFSMLHLSSSAPAVRANLVGSHITSSSFRVGLETWDGGILCAAEARWIEHRRGARDCAFGQVDTMEGSVLKGSYVKRIKFPKHFKDPPTVVCWLNRIDLGTGPGRLLRLRAGAGDVTTEGAVVRLGTWGQRTEMGGAGMCWIAFRKGKKHVDEGTFGVGAREGVRRKRVGSGGKGWETFREGAFERVPTVVAALEMFDMGGDRDLRIRVIVDEVTKEGFAWRIETWGDSVLNAARVRWIALGFV